VPPAVGNSPQAVEEFIVVSILVRVFSHPAEFNPGIELQ
jgi:hypothetical protein